MADLERHLHALAGVDDLYPSTPDIAAEVAARIGNAKQKHRPAWRPLAAIAALVLVALTATLAVPATRTAIADFLGIPGIRIEVISNTPDPAPGPPQTLGGSLLLGEQTTLAAVQQMVPHAVAIPDAIPAPPDEVYFSARSRMTVVALLWQSGPDLPPIGETGVGLLLLEITAADDFVRFATKLAAAGQIEPVELDGQTAYWIEGGVLVVEPVESLMLGPLAPTTRRSGHVLLWSDGTVAYRMETALPQADAVRLAMSLRPAGGPGNP